MTALLFVWVAVLFAAALVTARVYSRLNVIVLGQAAIMAVAAIVDYRATLLGLSPFSAVIIAVVVAAGIGIAYSALLQAIGGSLLLLATLLVEFVITELWIIATPITGGSAGVLLHQGSELTGSLIILTVLVSSGWALDWYVRGAKAFEWAAIRHMGPVASTLGIPVRMSLGAVLGVWGAVMGAAGVVAARAVGFISISLFGMTLSLMVVLIALAGARNDIVLGIVCIVTALVHVVIRQSTDTSALVASLYEIAVPVIALAVQRGSNVLWRPEGYYREILK